MDMKEIIEIVRADLRARPNSHFSEVYFRSLENRLTSTEVHNALYELLKRDEVATTYGKWRLLKEQLKEQRKASYAFDNLIWPHLDTYNWPHLINKEAGPVRQSLTIPAGMECRGRGGV